MMADLVSTLITYLKKGSKFRLSGRGTLEVRKRVALMGRNRATGEAIRIKGSK